MKLLTLFFVSVLVFGIVSFASGANLQNNASLQMGNYSYGLGNGSSGVGQNLSIEIDEKRTEYQPGNFTTSLGEFLNVREMAHGLRELREGNVSVKTNLTLIKVENHKNKLEAVLNDGSKVEIKVMPSTASKIALERLRFKACNESNNCSIELREVKNKGKVEYFVQIDRHSKILGIFQKKMLVSAEVDAETGKVIDERRPWWAFIALGPLE